MPSYISSEEEVQQLIDEYNSKRRGPVLSGEEKSVALEKFYQEALKGKSWGEHLIEQEIAVNTEIHPCGSKKKQIIWQINQYTLKEAANKVHNAAARQLGYNEMEFYQNSYNSIIEDYDNSIHRFSSSIKVTQLRSFRDWLPYLIENKFKIMPNLIANMLKSDIYAFKMYETLQLVTGAADILVDDENKCDLAKIPNGFLLAGYNGAAKLNAVKWLESSEAAQIIHDSSPEIANDLCAAIGILAADNSLAGCVMY